MPDSISNINADQPTTIIVPLANPPGAAPGRTDVLYNDESTPQTRADHQAEKQLDKDTRSAIISRLREQPVDSTWRQRAASDTANLPWSHHILPEMASPLAVGRERGSTGRYTVTYLRGIPAEDRPALPGYDSGTMALLLGVFLVIASNFRHYSTFLKTFTQDLWSVRKRGNVFDDRTVSEARIMGSLILLTCVCEGILLFCGVNDAAPIPLRVFPAICIGLGIAVTYYVWQLIAYSVSGYSFASKTARRQWLKGFNASQALLGLTLVIPAVTALFNPALSRAMAITGAILYITARIIFICKGFRLFYENFFSLVYFILYLCTLEIAPLWLVYKTIGAMIPRI